MFDEAGLVASGLRDEGSQVPRHEGQDLKTHTVAECVVNFSFKSVVLDHPRTERSRSPGDQTRLGPRDENPCLGLPLSLLLIPAASLDSVSRVDSVQGKVKLSSAHS